VTIVVESSSSGAAGPAGALDAADMQIDWDHIEGIRTLLAAFVVEVARTCGCVVRGFVTKRRMLES